MSYYDANTRAELRAAVISAGTTPDRADQVVDLACHAAEQAVDKLMSIIKGAPDGAIGMMAIELGTQLAASRMTEIFEKTHELGRASGLPYAATVIGGSR